MLTVLDKIAQSPAAPVPRKRPPTRARLPLSAALLLLAIPAFPQSEIPNPQFSSIPQSAVFPQSPIRNPQSSPLPPLSDEAIFQKQLFEAAARAYANGKPDDARQTWADILQKDPENALAAAWLRSTQRESDKRHGFPPLNQDDSLLGYDGPPVTVQTGRVVSIAQFMDLLARATNGKIRYTIAPGADAQVFLSAQDQPPLKALDAALRPTELYWSVEPGGAVAITDRPARAGFALSDWEAAQFKSLMQAGEGSGLWGGTDAPSRHFNLQLDVQARRILSSGTGVDIKRIDSLIAAMRKMEQIDPAKILVARTYKLDNQNSPRLMSLVQSSIGVRNNNILGPAPSMFYIEGEKAILRDTQRNIDQIDAQLLMPQTLPSQPRRLITESYNLRPDNAQGMTRETMQQRAANAVEAIKLQLYGMAGDPEYPTADDERKIAYDAAALQLTVTDTQQNLDKVAEYTNSIRGRASVQ